MRVLQVRSRTSLYWIELSHVVMAMGVEGKMRMKSADRKRSPSSYPLPEKTHDEAVTFRRSLRSFY